MDTHQLVKERSGNACELCHANENTSPYEIQPQDKSNTDNTIMICAVCLAQIEKKEPLNNNHWKVLSETMWSEVPGVQVVAWRMLNRLKNEAWAAEQLDMLYLDETNLAWAKAAGDEDDDGTVDLHKDSNGAILQNGDTVVLTKSLDVKGSTLNAKMGTVVKNIRLVPENTEQVEGKIEGQVIVILTKYVRKQGA
ncbi:MAG TPA: PhnA domain-containing protein [Ferruginibacter sp.]|nr:PhnA domain-containing protein [Ferruginibacter sp.]HRO06544.1 PhnA domain-containing protein [Ferruginibacter sp.]HRO96714.1 PhnA domain-containing protein [Ferruginibacter sp.]HRP50150.1 PhnA domain-containing protein [Ferruginibacter sp.]